MSSLDFSFRRKPPESQGSGLTLDTALLDCSRDNLFAGAEPGITFAKQDELPRLPIPELQDTLNKFLQHLEALHESDEERLHAQQVVLEFIKGDGPKLQELLKSYEHEGVKTGTLGSYIEEFWNDTHLVPDPSAVLDLNPFFMFDDGPDSRRVTTKKDPMIRRAASLCFATVKLASAIREESILPDTFKGNPLCMDQYKAVFGAARVPNAEGGDDLEVYPQSSHVVAMCRNQLFYFSVLWPDGTVAVDEEDIVEILTAIETNSKTLNLGEAARTCPGVLTTLDRQKWSKIRTEISELGHNDHYLTIIDSGLFVLVLDDFIPNSVDEAATNMLHGTHTIKIDCQDNNTNTNTNTNTNNNPNNNNNINNINNNVNNNINNHDNNNYPDPNYPGSQVGSCCNRWYDKFQIIVCGDGTAGVNFEHSAVDGHTALRVASDIYAETVVNFAQSITKTIPANGKIPHVIEATVDRAGASGAKRSVGDKRRLDILPKKLALELTSNLEKKIFHAETALGDSITSCETNVLDFTDYGKQLVVSNSMSPDAYVQMSIMLAAHKLTGKMACAYEPVLTKSFFHGRTEAMRPATVPAKHLCEIFFDTTTSPKQKLNSLRRAVAVHTKYVQECSIGKGVDRHLFSLKCIAIKEGLPVPAFFHSEPWKLLNHTILFTSNCGNPALRLFGFGPAVPNGYGIGYIINDHSIHFSVSSKRGRAKRFVNALSSVLKEMALLLSKRSKSARTIDHHDQSSRLDHHGDTMHNHHHNNRDLEAAARRRRGVLRKEANKREAKNNISNGNIPENEDSTPNIEMEFSIESGPPNMSSQKGRGAKPRRNYNVEETLRMSINQSEHTVLHTNFSSPNNNNNNNNNNNQKSIRERRTSNDVSFSRRSAPAISSPMAASDSQPTKPKRRGSTFGRMSEKEILSTEQLSMSGVSLDLEFALDDDSDTEYDSDAESYIS